MSIAITDYATQSLPNPYGSRPGLEGLRRGFVSLYAGGSPENPQDVYRLSFSGVGS
jgi:hypothetical protein